jgi:hypothetical protein
VGSVDCCNSPYKSNIMSYATMDKEDIYLIVVFKYCVVIYAWVVIVTKVQPFVPFYFRHSNLNARFLIIAIFARSLIICLQYTKLISFFISTKYLSGRECWLSWSMPTKCSRSHPWATFDSTIISSS